ncbi:MAG: hypothetical protein IKV86_02485 [Clostridia bacterium]|nr:hypothetical protein [Clostridia bacterium]
MRNIIQKSFDLFLGINFTVGIVTVVWRLLDFALTVPEFSPQNILFMMISCAVPWLTNFIFSYTSKLYMKGMLHAVVWFVADIIIFNLMYKNALGAFVLLWIAAVFAAVYGITLYGFYHISSKLNIPVRHTTEFCAKLATSFNKK